MHAAIEDFRSTWPFVHQMTFDFANAVPDQHWDASPHARYRSFAKQLRHIVCVQGVYIHALRKREADFGRKHSYYGGGLDRTELIAALKEKDRELFAALSAIDEGDADAWQLDWFGSVIGVGRFLYVLIQHESLHHGQWSFYASLAGFETPASWRLNWGL